MCDVCDIQARKLLFQPAVTETQLTSIQALEAVVRIEGNNQLRNGLGNLSYEIANDYLVEEFTIDKGEHRTVITLSLAPKAMLKGSREEKEVGLEHTGEGRDIGEGLYWIGEGNNNTPKGRENYAAAQQAKLAKALGIGSREEKGRKQ